VATSYPVVRRYLEDLLATSPDLEVVAVAGDAEEVLATADAHGSDVVLLGLAPPETDGVRSTRAIRAARPGIAVVVLSDSCLAHDVLNAIEAGATGYLLKDLDPAELSHAVRAAVAGDTPLSPQVAKAILGVRRQRSATDGLTPRGSEVLVLLGQGLTDQGIARRLGIAEKTVKLT